MRDATGRRRDQELAALVRQPDADRRRRPVFHAVDPDAPPPPEFTALLAAAAHGTTASIMITDDELDEPGPRILYVNPTFEEMTGYLGEQVMGRSPRFLQGPATDQSVLRRLRRDLGEQGYFTGEAINYRADGEPFVMAWQIREIISLSGIRRYVAIQSDVTDERVRDQAEHEAARRLQEQLLPRVPERLDGFELCTRYRSADGYGTVGGDWYDALTTPSGDVALVVGDIAGQGLDATAVMGRLRWTVRTLLETGADLPSTLAHVRRVSETEKIVATLVVAVLDGTSDRVELATLGHPPVVVKGPGHRRRLRTPNPLIGVPVESDTVMVDTLADDEMLVLFTDGLLDDFRRELDDLLADLDDIDTSPTRPLGAIADEILDRSRTDGASDDTALLLARRAH